MGTCTCGVCKCCQVRRLRRSNLGTSGGLLTWSRRPPVGTAPCGVCMCKCRSVRRKTCRTPLATLAHASAGVTPRGRALAPSMAERPVSCNITAPWAVPTGSVLEAMWGGWVGGGTDQLGVLTLTAARAVRACHSRFALRQPRVTTTRVRSCTISCRARDLPAAAGRLAGVASRWSEEGSPWPENVVARVPSSAGLASSGETTAPGGCAIQR